MFLNEGICIRTFSREWWGRLLYIRLGLCGVTGFLRCVQMLFSTKCNWWTDRGGEVGRLGGTLSKAFKYLGGRYAIMDVTVRGVSVSDAGMGVCTLVGIFECFKIAL